MRILKQYNTYKELNDWYNNKYIEMGDGWDCPEQSAMEYLSFMDIEFKPHSSTLLDIGCGAGHFIQTAEKFLKCTGIEISTEGARLSRLRTMADIRVLNIEDDEAFLKLGKRYKYITSIGSIEHCIDIEKALSNIYKLLMKQGRFFALLPNDKWLYYDQPNEVTRTHKDWKEFIELAGFQCIKDKEVNDLSYYLFKI